MSLDKILPVLILMLLLAGCLTGREAAESKPKVDFAGALEIQPHEAVSPYVNPTQCVADAENNRVYVALAGPCKVAVVNSDAEALAASWDLPGVPTGLALTRDGNWLAVTLGETTGEVVLLDTQSGDVVQRFAAGYSPRSPVFLENGSTIAVANRFENAVRFFNAQNGREIARLETTREPYALMASPDESAFFVTGFLPSQKATAMHVAASIDVIDLKEMEKIKSILLPNGATAVRDLALSADGKYLFATHVIGHHQVPTNQLERGWMNANAMSIIDVAAREHKETVLLDDTTLGASNPWGLAVTADGEYLAVVHTGTHEISVIPFKPFIEIVERGHVDPSEHVKRQLDREADQADLETDSLYDTKRLVNELRTMMQSGRYRVAMPGDGPRDLAIVGSKVLVAEYYAGKLAVVDLSDPKQRFKPPREIALGDQPEMDQVRQGELRFGDARLCFQGWQSCISCHPNVRSDALNWDLLNDGVGNPKQSKSMLLSHQTPPVMARGVRARAEVAVRAGIRFIQFAQVVEEDAEAIDAYLSQLEPQASPYLVNGRLSEKAVRGKAVFEKAGCADCHSGPLFTDQRSYKIPYAVGLDKNAGFDTPTLIEVWRTGPWLYDGRANTMQEALRIHEGEDLSEKDMDALVEYVMSL